MPGFSVRSIPNAIAPGRERRGRVKYFVFIVAALGTPALAFVLAMNRRWLKWVFCAMVAALCAYIPTSINFFSHEHYRGSSRGMEVSVIHLLACGALGAMSMRGKGLQWFPDWGSRVYAVYFLACLPSFGTAANGLYSWFEIWKMLLLPLVFAAVFNYLKKTDDLDTVMGALAGFAVANVLVAVKQHFAGAFQSHGVFPHQNSMAMGMLLLGPAFFAGYVSGGLKGKIGKLRAVAFAGAGLATLLSYSRGALAMVPVGYGLAGLVCLVRGRTRGWMLRLLPVVLMGVAVGVEMAPQFVDRFLHAPESSGDTRVELALCAREMIKDKPLCGVGINNWGVKINPPYDYAVRAGREQNRGEEFADGIVETVYLLVCAECGIPALLLMLAWFGWYWIACWRLIHRYRGTPLFWIPAGFVGGLTSIYLQSALEWVLRQQMNMILLMFVFAVLAYLDGLPRGGRPEARRKEIVAATGVA